MRYFLSKEDHYTQKARAEGYPARSVYKLQEINRKFNIFQEGNGVLDLGAAPGSWLLYISKKVGPKGRVVGVDTEDLKIEMPANSIFIKKSVFDDDFSDVFSPVSRHPMSESFQTSDVKNFDVVVSDLAPKTSGLHEKDVALCLELAERALFIAEQALQTGGYFVVKLFEGTGVNDFVKEVSKSFKIVKRYRPQAIRKGSREFYLIAKNYEREYTAGDNLVT